MNATNSSTNPKRVAGGIVLGGKKKKKRRIFVAAAGASTSASNSNVPSILKSVPPRISSPPNVAAAAAAAGNDDEFDELLMNNDDEIPNDALLCLQSYTQSSLGMTAESSAYCPIFATNNDGRGDKVCTHLAPFLPKNVLLHILDTDSSSSRMQTEQDIKSLASKNKIRLLQLHGTAITATNTTSSSSSSFRDSKVASAKFSNNGVTGLRGDGNDDDDIAIMEIIAYETAVKMALQSHTSTLRQEEQQTCDTDAICDWFLKQLVPYYAGKTWISSSNLNSFVQSYRVKEYWSVDRMTKVIHELTLAGLFLPRRGLGGSRMEGYWFSLPGLGSTSKSIADGRVAILRKLRSCKYQEKKRSILEREHGQFKDGSDDTTLADSSWGVSKKKTCIRQSGRFVVLDLLAKGLVVLKKTSSGEHFIGLPK
eukprot:scaffold5944_cov102-Skeletonema_marinoi.AAC.3